MAEQFTTTTTKPTAKVTLHWLNKSRAHRVLWLLEELNVDYDLKVYKRGDDMYAPKELKDLHPLGKSPVITIQGPDGPPVVLAETGAIVEYLIDHFGPQLIPTRYPAGKEGQPGAETEEWIRYRYFMHYAEGSIMPFLVFTLVIDQIRGPMVPWIVRPISRAIASGIEAAFSTPNLTSHFKFIESQLSTSPDNGQFICGPKLTGADIMLVYPLENARHRAGMMPAKYPKADAYVTRLQERDAYKRAIAKAEEATGEKFDNLFN